MNTHPPALDLDLFVAGEGDHSNNEAVTRHVEQCAECRRYVDDRLAEQATQMAQLAPQVLAHQVAERFDASQKPLRPSPHQAGSRLWVWGVAFAGLAAAAAVVLALLILPDDRGNGVGPDGPRDDITWMGTSPVVRLQILRGDQLVDDTEPTAGDRLQYEVTMPPGEVGYAMVIAWQGDYVFPVLPEDGIPAEASDVGWIPGSVTFEPGGVVRLFVFVRPEPYTALDLVGEVREAYVEPERVVNEPSGLVHRMTVDLNL